MQLISYEQLNETNQCSHNAANYVRDFNGHLGKDYISNLNTKLLLLHAGEEYLPVSINNGKEKIASGEKNSYVVSPTTTYIDYAKIEIAALNKRWLTWPLSVFVILVGTVLRLARIDRVIHINNWLLSTNLYAATCFHNGVKKIEQLKEFFIDAYPGFAISFRSLNEISNQQTIEELQNAGFIAIPSRQVYLFDGSTGKEAAFWKKHNTQIDAKALAKMRYQLSDGNEFSEEDFYRCEQLYRLLYIDKYTSLNPQYSCHWLAAGQQHGWLKLIGLRNTQGKLEGVVGFFENDHIITAPIVGYNTALPAKEALYRLLTQLCLQRAIAHNKLLNFSSGAAEFKRLRGGVPAIEYTMVYVAHLNVYSRSCWKVLGYILHTIAVPLMKRWQL